MPIKFAKGCRGMWLWASSVRPLGRSHQNTSCHAGGQESYLFLLRCIQVSVNLSSVKWCEISVTCDGPASKHILTHISDVFLIFEASTFYFFVNIPQ